MIAHDILVQEIDPRHWANLWRLLGVERLLMPAFLPPPAEGAAAEPGTAPSRAARHGPVVLIVETGRVIRAIDLGGRRAFPPPPWDGAAGLDAIRKRLGAPFVVAFEDGGLEGLFAEVESALRFGNDPMQDLLDVLGAVRRRLGKDVHVSPRPFAGRIPLPTYGMVRAAVDLLWPPNTAACFYLFEGGKPWTSIIVARDRTGMLDVFTTHLALAESRGAFRASSVRDRELVLKEIARITGRPVHVGFFATLEAWERALRDGDGFEAERSRGGLAIDPAPPWLRAVMGASQVARTARAATSLFAAMAPRTAAAIAGGIERVTSAAGGASLLDPLRVQLSQLLGFDPLSPDGPLAALVDWLRDTVRGFRGRPVPKAGA